MSASIVLDRAWIGLWSDPSTQLRIPHLQGAPITLAYAGTTVQFVGDTYPTGFRGDSSSKSFAMQARYMADEQADLADLLALFDSANAAADSRLLLRTSAGQVAGLNEATAVQVFGVTTTPSPDGYWDVSFTATVVEHSFAV